MFRFSPSVAAGFVLAMPEVEIAAVVFAHEREEVRSARRRGLGFLVPAGGQRCLECGGCTYVCPACTCFTVSDRQVGPDEFERVRIWDACALSGFTRMAGGFNPRRAVHDRRNRRFFRKLAHYFIQR